MRSHFALLLRGLVALPALAGALLPQQPALYRPTGHPDPNTGYGNRFIETFDVGSATGSGSFTGVTELGGRLYATTTRAVFELDMHGALVRRVSTSAVAFYDGATDGRALLLATDAGITAIGPNGGPVMSVVAADGPQAVSMPIRVRGYTGRYRGLAFDPGGNDGRGSLWVGDGPNDLVETSLDGRVLRTLAWHGQDACGLAIDPNGGAGATLWVNSGARAGLISEYDLGSGAPTGNHIERVQELGRPGGLSGYRGVDGYFGLIALNCAARDEITGYRIDLYGAVPGEIAPMLITGVGHEPLTPSSPKYFDGSQSALTFGFTPPDREPSGGLPGCLIINPAPWTGTDGATPGLPEFAGLHAASTPVGFAWMIPIVIDPERTTTMPIPHGIFGDSLRVQAVYPEPRAPYGVACTNQARWVLR